MRFLQECKIVKFLQKCKVAKLCLLRERGFLSVIYVDDSYPQGDSFEECFLKHH